MRPADWFGTYAKLPFNLPDKKVFAPCALRSVILLVVHFLPLTLQTKSICVGERTSGEDFPRKRETFNKFLLGSRMKKLARFALIITLSAAYAAPSKPSVGSTTSGQLAWGSWSEESSISPSPLSVASTAPARPSLAAPSSAATTLPSDIWLNGASGYARAVELQRELNVPMVVYFYADWCSYCRTLDNQYLPSAPVQDYLRGVVKVRINPEHGPAERALATRYSVKGYPSFFVMRGRSATRPATVSPFRRVANLTPTQFANACRAIAPVSRKATAVKGSGTSGKFRERGSEVVTKRTTTNGGSQIVTVVPTASASRKAVGRRQ